MLAALTVLAVFARASIAPPPPLPVLFEDIDTLLAQLPTPAAGEAVELAAKRLTSYMHTSALLTPACERAKALARSGAPLTIVHPMPTWPVKPNSRLHENLIAMRIAKQYASECSVEVTLLRVRHRLEPHALPDGFVEAPGYFTSSIDTAGGREQRVADAMRKHHVAEFPNTQSIINQVKAHILQRSRSSTVGARHPVDLIVLTNADVMTYPDAYVKLGLLSRSGPDAFSFTRMSIERPASGGNTALEKYFFSLKAMPKRTGNSEFSDVTEHPGIDGWAFAADLLPCIEFGDVHWGCAPFGQLVWAELRRVSESCVFWIGGVPDTSANQFTFHPAEAGDWGNLKRRYTQKTDRQGLWEDIGVGQYEDLGLNSRWGSCLNDRIKAKAVKYRHFTGGNHGHIDALLLDGEGSGAPGSKQQCTSKRNALEIQDRAVRCVKTWGAFASKQGQWKKLSPFVDLWNGGKDGRSELFKFFGGVGSTDARLPGRNVRWDEAVKAAHGQVVADDGVAAWNFGVPAPKCAACAERVHINDCMWRNGPGGTKGETYTSAQSADKCCDAAAQRAAKERITIYWSFTPVRRDCYMKVSGEFGCGKDPGRPGAKSGCTS